MSHKKKIYDDYRRNLYGTSNLAGGRSDRRRREQYALLYEQYLPSDRETRILDVGCGSGYLMEYLVEKGYRNVKGVDASADQVRYAVKNGLSVVESDALDFLGGDKVFDLILSTDVIEHLEKSEVLEFLEKAYNSLSPGGALLVRTGNMSSVYGPTIRYIDFTHEVGFTEKSLRQVLRTAGFEEIYITDSKVPFGFMPRRLARWLLVKAWRGLLGLVYYVEVGTDRPRLFGKLLLAHARKQGSQIIDGAE